MNPLRRTLLVALAAGFGQSCAPIANKRADGGMSGTGSPMVTIGTLTNFGSVVVNGFRWDTSAAGVVINGAPAQAKALRLGMVVRVEGARSAQGRAEGSARTLQYEADVVGPLQRDSIDGGGSGTGITTLKIAGQTLFAGADTRFEGFAALIDLEHNDLLEVSGYRDRAGLLHATWIKRIGGIELLASDVRIKGIAREVKPTKFMVGDLSVSIPAHTVREGDFVAVTGKWRVATPELAASAAQTLPTAVNLPENVPVIMEGLIRTVSAAGFTMHNRPIAIRSATTFENGSARDLHEDGKVHVEGVFKAGVFDAARIIIAATR